MAAWPSTSAIRCLGRMTAAALLLACLGFAGAAMAASGAGCDRSGWQTYKRIPSALVGAAYQPGERPNAAGLAGHNALAGVWLQVGMQRGPLVPMVAAALRGDHLVIDRNWAAVETAFAHQRPDGSFPMAAVVAGKRTSAEGEATSAAFFVAQLATVILLVEESPSAADYAARIDGLDAPLARAVGNLSQPSRVRDMLRVDGLTTNRLLMDAKALILGGTLTGQAVAVQAGQRILMVALGLQRADGSFPEAHGSDSGYQADSLLDLSEIAAFHCDAGITEALRRGMGWELRRIDGHGDVDVTGNTRTGLRQEIYFGHAKGINYPELVRALSLYSALTGDAAAERAAFAVVATQATRREELR